MAEDRGEKTGCPSWLTVVEGGAGQGDKKDMGLDVLTHAVLKVATSTAVGKQRLSTHPSLLHEDAEEPRDRFGSEGEGS